MSRADDARRLADLAAAQEAGEAQRAQRLIDAFVERAEAAGLPAVALRAVTPGGASLKTDKRGWYLRRNRSLAIGTDGGLYILAIPEPGVVAKLRGVRLTPTPPSLTVGRGGRDGESGDLSWFLERALGGDV